MITEQNRQRLAEQVRQALLIHGAATVKVAIIRAHLSGSTDAIEAMVLTGAWLRQYRNSVTTDANKLVAEAAAFRPVMSITLEDDGTLDTVFSWACLGYSGTLRYHGFPEDEEVAHDADEEFYGALMGDVA
ncbi:MAG: hypothetical protein QNJ97_17775 [Myxococcota bacterium]|nr:hypothetical protein [Myxococcota bacterium]